jgi:hypothetical protein
MTQGKAYRLKNGIILETEAELKAYTRGLEMARAASEACTEGRTEFLAKMSAALEEAHDVKTVGPKSESDLAAEADAAAKAKAEAEKPAEEEKSAADEVSVGAEKASE